MSKISDDIRKWCFEDGTEYGGSVTKSSLDKLYDLADRMDAEMVELPRDMDGLPIHVGDTVFARFGDGEEETVSSITLTGGTAAVTTACRGIKAGFRPSELTHTRPDSLERIAEELDEQAGSLTKDGYTWQEDAIHDFADRIRKLARKEASDE